MKGVLQEWLVVLMTYVGVGCQPLPLPSPPPLPTRVLVLVLVDVDGCASSSSSSTCLPFKKSHVTTPQFGESSRQICSGGEISLHVGINTSFDTCPSSTCRRAAHDACSSSSSMQHAATQAPSHHLADASMEKEVWMTAVRYSLP